MKQHQDMKAVRFGFEFTSYTNSELTMLDWTFHRQQYGILWSAAVAADRQKAQNVLKL